MNLNQRWLIRADMPRVLEIERLSYPQPWSSAQFLLELRTRNSVAIVLERECHIVGFIVYRLGNQSIEIVKLAVHPDYRKTGVGRALIDKLKTKLSMHHRKKMFASVRETNLDAQLFFRSCGLQCNQVVDGLYPNEPAYVFECFRVPLPQGVAIAGVMGCWYE